MSSCVRRVRLAQLLYFAAWGTNDTNLKPRWRHTQSCKNIRIGNFFGQIIVTLLLQHIMLF